MYSDTTRVENRVNRQYKIPNNEIVASQICHDIANGDNFTKQIRPNIQHA